MAAGTLPKPGTKYGPCEGSCQHIDCAWTRKMAAKACPICDKPIGYDTRFYQTDESHLAHSLCEEERIQAAHNRIEESQDVADVLGALADFERGERRS